MTERWIAERIARLAHAGQTEESTGDDYIRHVERVVGLVDGDDAKAVAWLHDVIEDSDWTAVDLARAGIAPLVIAAVELLTHDPRVSYEEYIAALVESQAPAAPLARAVKRADLRDHLRPNCPARLQSRYEAALIVLTGPAIESLSDGRT